MRGARAKSLRREYTRTMGEAPAKVEITKINEKTGEVAYKQSVWRILKKEYVRFRRDYA